MTDFHLIQSVAEIANLKSDTQDGFYYGTLLSNLMNVWWIPG